LLKILFLVLSILIPILLVACSSGVPAVDEPTPSAGSSVAKIQPTIEPTIPPTIEPTATPTIEPTATQIPLPPPVVFTPYNGFLGRDENGISHDSIGTPVLNIGYMNVSEIFLDAVEFRICPKNRFGDALKQFGHGDNCLIGVTDKVVIPFVDGTDRNNKVQSREKGELSDYLPFTSEKFMEIIDNTNDTPAGRGEWTLYGYETAVEAEITLVRVHFQDGTVWKAN